MKKTLILTLCFCLAIPMFAQRKLKAAKAKADNVADTALLAKKIVRDSDTTAVATSKSKPLSVKQLFEPNGRHSPRTAVILSLVLPGAGQVYNRRWWKVPIVYAGLGGMAYLYQQNNTSYNRFKKEYIARAAGRNVDASLNFYTYESLQTYRDFYRSNTEFSALGFIVIYMLNGVDAFVDGHLYSFKKDIKQDVGLQLRPTLQAQPDGSLAPSIGMTYQLQQPSAATRLPKLTVF